MSDGDLLVGSGFVSIPSEYLLASATAPHVARFMKRELKTLENARVQKQIIQRKSRPAQKRIGQLTKRLAGIEDQLLNPKVDEKTKEGLRKDREILAKQIQDAQASINAIRKTDRRMQRLDRENTWLNTLGKSQAYGLSLVNPQGAGWAREFEAQMDLTETPIDEVIGGAAESANTVRSVQIAPLGFQGFTFYGGR